MKDSNNSDILSQYYTSEERELKGNEDTPLIVLTWPRAAWKTHFLEILLNTYWDTLEIVPQLSYREQRLDDNPDYIQLVSSEEFLNLKDEFLVACWKYWILQRDVERVISKQKVPICILGWKEILKIKKANERELFTINITFPNELDWSISDEVKEIIYNERLIWRWLSKESKTENLELIESYMKLFFNHPVFQKVFDINFLTIEERTDELTRIVWSIVEVILSN